MTWLTRLVQIVRRSNPTGNWGPSCFANSFNTSRGPSTMVKRVNDLRWIMWGNTFATTFNDHDCFGVEADNFISMLIINLGTPMTCGFGHSCRWRNMASGDGFPPESPNRVTVLKSSFWQGTRYCWQTNDRWHSPSLGRHLMTFPIVEMLNGNGLLMPFVWTCLTQSNQSMMSSA